MFGTIASYRIEFEAAVTWFFAVVVPLTGWIILLSCQIFKRNATMELAQERLNEARKELEKANSEINGLKQDVDKLYIVINNIEKQNGNGLLIHDSTISQPSKSLLMP